MRELLLLRHGTTEANERRVFTGAMDIPLSENGRRALAPLRGLYPPAGTFFTSGMRRAVETLELLYGTVSHTDIPDLGEYRFGVFEGRNHEDLFANEPFFRAWLAEDGQDVVCPGGESRRAFDSRVCAGWTKLVAHEWTGLAVLVSHGGVIMSAMRQFAPGSALSQTPGNACGFRACLSDDGGITAFEHFAAPGAQPAPPPVGTSPAVPAPSEGKECPA